jgi:hypothetical protein
MIFSFLNYFGGLGVIGGEGGRVGIIEVAVVSMTSFGLQPTPLFDLEGFFVYASTALMATLMMRER